MDDDAIELTPFLRQELTNWLVKETDKAWTTMVQKYGEPKTQDGKPSTAHREAFAHVYGAGLASQAAGKDTARSLGMADVLSGGPLSTRGWLIACAGVVAMSVGLVACDVTGRLPPPAPRISTDEHLVEQLSKGKRPMPVREALGIPDARYVCRPLDASATPQDAVAILRDRFDRQMPDTRFEPRDHKGPYLYVVDGQGERLVLVPNAYKALDGAFGEGEACVEAARGEFVWAYGAWRLRSGVLALGSPEGRSLVRSLGTAKSPTPARILIDAEPNDYLCLSRRPADAIVDWMVFVEKADFPDTAMHPSPALHPLEIGLFITGRKGERYVKIPAGEGLGLSGDSLCLRAKDAVFVRRGEEWALRSRKALTSPTAS